MKSVNRIKMLSAREQVASIVRQQILTGQYMENQEITLGEIAEQVGSSITPVREAFQMLENEGLIRLRLNKGAIVLGLNEKTIHDHYETRAVLESFEAGKVCEEGTDISSIIAVQDESAKAISSGNVELYRDYNQAFHMSIWQTAGNKRIEQMLSTLWNGFSLGFMITEEQYAQISFSEHTEIFDAIKNHDKAAAESLMFRHIMRSMNDILEGYRQEKNK